MSTGIEACTERTIGEFLAMLRLGDDGSDGVLRTGDGWRHALSDADGFRHDYDDSVARGGWEFYRAGDGIYLAIVDMTVVRQALRIRHRNSGYLILSAVLEGDASIDAGRGHDGSFANGYCTLYGQGDEEQFETYYEPGTRLRWVSVFIERHSLTRAMGLCEQDLPQPIRDFLLQGTPLAPRNIPMSRAASLTALQILECPFENDFRRALLRSQAQALACHLLFALSNDIRDPTGGVTFTDEDQRRLARAMQRIRSNLEQPPNIDALAVAVGLPLQKLQHGFRLVYGDTVARIRDKMRMEHALRLVRTTGVSMTEIALQTGYDHAASFTRAFKSAYGVSPTRMRRMAQENNVLAQVAGRHG